MVNFAHDRAPAGEPSQMENKFGFNHMKMGY